MDLREELSFKYLRGEGIEIGALHTPLKVGPDAHVTYVDKVTREKLAEQYADVPLEKILRVDIVCDGVTLDRVGDSSFDFVIANHLLEHVPDLLMALDNWFRVLRPKGILYLTVPDMRRTFDVDRPLTSLEHIVADNTGSTERDPRIDLIHFLEWVTYVHHKFPHPPIPKTELYKEAMQLQQHVERTHGSIHYHTFVEESLLQLLRLTEKRCNAKIIEFRDNKSSIEFVSILQKE